jgi:hypothetical protein
MTARTWGSASIAGTYLYDAAKRPIGLYIRLGGATSASVLARTYDAIGNVTSETQNLAGVGGGAGNATLAGSGTETFTYDNANRVVAAGFGAPGAQTDTRAYTYDHDSNRTSVTESGVTVYYFYDATDALVTKSLANTTPNPGTSCTSLGFCYDAFGDLTSSSPSGPDASSADDLVVVHTNYSYDPAGHLSAITDGTSADAVSFTIDALGRHATQTIGSNPTSTYCLSRHQRLDHHDREQCRYDIQHHRRHRRPTRERRRFRHRLDRARPPRQRRGRHWPRRYFRGRLALRPIRPDRGHLDRHQRLGEDALAIPGPDSRVRRYR